MNPQQLAKKLEKQRRDLLINEEKWPREKGAEALRWVQQNFADESYMHNVQIPWKKLK